MASEEYREFYRRAVAALSEGFCPQHRVPLEPCVLPGDGTRAGWCGACPGGWFIDGGEVVVRYPWP